MNKRRSNLPNHALSTGTFCSSPGWAGASHRNLRRIFPSSGNNSFPRSAIFRGKKSEVTYGICCNPDGQGGFEYIAGVEIDKLDDLPEKYRWVEVQPQQYAVFEHKGSLDSLPATFQYIWKTWLPQSGRQAADAPEFERYSEDFNPTLNTGVLEIWLPLKD